MTEGTTTAVTAGHELAAGHESAAGRVLAAWRWARSGCAPLLDGTDWRSGAPRRRVIVHRARAIALSALGALSTLVGWAVVGPAVVAEVRRLVSAVIDAGPIAQNQAIVAAISVWLIAWWIRRAVRGWSATHVNDGALAPGVPVAEMAVAPTVIVPEVARHEAAHAVVAHALGGTLVAVRAVPGGGLAGQCTWSIDLAENTDATANAWRELSFSLAGAIASPEGATAWPGARGDTVAAVSQAAFISTSGVRPAGYDGALTIDGVLSGARWHTSKLLSARRGSLDALTAALIERGTLSGADAAAVLDEHPGAAPEAARS